MDPLSEYPSQVMNNKSRARVCPICSKTFSHSSSLEVHMRIHSGERPFPCSKCGRAFIQKAHVQRHEKICGKSNKPKQAAAYLQLIPQAIQDNIRKEKGKRIDDLFPPTPHSPELHTTQPPSFVSSLPPPTQVLRSKDLQCAKCPEKFVDQLSLLEHIYQFHRDDPSSSLDNPPLPSDRAESSSISGAQRLSSSRLHLRTAPHSTLPIHCRICFKRFSSKRTLKVHNRIHTGERPFACKLCPKRFIQRVHLLKHIAAHVNRTTNSSSHRFNSNSIIHHPDGQSTGEGEGEASMNGNDEIGMGSNNSNNNQNDDGDEDEMDSSVPTSAACSFPTVVNPFDLSLLKSDNNNSSSTEMTHNNNHNNTQHSGMGDPANNSFLANVSQLAAANPEVRRLMIMGHFIQQDPTSLHHHLHQQHLSTNQQNDDMSSGSGGNGENGPSEAGPNSPPMLHRRPNNNNNNNNSHNHNHNHNNNNSINGNGNGSSSKPNSTNGEGGSGMVMMGDVVGDGKNPSSSQSSAQMMTTVNGGTSSDCSDSSDLKNRNGGACPNCVIMSGELSLLRAELTMIKQFLSNKLNLMEQKVDNLKSTIDS